MTQKKKAELQRKLSIAPVPRPPDDLLNRIKADIPDYLRTEQDRDRFSRSVAFNLRVAASILLVITSAFLGIRLLSPESQKRGMAPVPTTASVSYEELSQKQAAEVTVTIDEAVPQAAQAEYKKETDVMMTRSRREAESNVAALPPPPAAPVLAPPPPPPAAAAPAMFDAAAGSATASAPVPEPAPASLAVAPVEVAAAPPAVTAESPRVAEGRRDVAAQRAAPAAKTSAGFIGSVQAADLAYETRPELFGVAIDAREFDRLKKMVESQTRPEPDSVNVEALVNHFAGAPASIKRDVDVQIEGSQAPLPDGPAMLRVTVDTALMEDGATGTRPPVGTDATLRIDINDAAVTSYKVVGSGELWSAERLLLRGSSATRLIELTLKPGLRRSQEVARVTLRYRSLRTGKEVVIPRTLTAGEVSRQWTSSSRRHRLATLGALWGKSLGAAEPSGEEVAKKAESLSSEEPDDARARELAVAARTSSGSGRS